MLSRPARPESGRPRLVHDRRRERRRNRPCLARGRPGSEGRESSTARNPAAGAGPTPGRIVRGNVVRRDRRPDRSGSANIRRRDGLVADRGADRDGARRDQPPDPLGAADERHPLPPACVSTAARGCSGLEPGRDAAARVPGLQRRCDGGGAGRDRGRARRGARCRRAGSRFCASAMRAPSCAAVARLLLDRDHRIVEVTQPMFGTSITIRPTDRATALRPHPPTACCAMPMVRSPFRIPGNALQGHIRYRFAFSGTGSTSICRRPASSASRPRDAAQARQVDICAACGPGLPRQGGARRRAAPDPLAAKRPSAAPRDRRAVRADGRSDAAEDGAAAARSASSCRSIRRPLFGAGNTARRAGDCTEAAVLLAALGRAAESRPGSSAASSIRASAITASATSSCRTAGCWPMSTANGGASISALERFDSSHIALTVGDGDARSIGAANQLASLLDGRDDRGQGPSGRLTGSSRGHPRRSVLIGDGSSGRLRSLGLVGPIRRAAVPHRADHVMSGCECRSAPR